MSRHHHTYALAAALALTVAGAPQATQAKPLSAQPPASRATTLAERECIAYEMVNGKPVCIRWNDCKPGDKVC
jgi:hypothetical protein